MADRDQNPALDADDQDRVRLRFELHALGDRLESIEKDLRELRAQFDRALASANLFLRDQSEHWAAPQTAPAPPSPQPTVARSSKMDGTKLHQDAVRYARLLVAEIELYNKDEVARGRENKDLYARLKHHIDRSRKAYNSRFGRNVIPGPAYFDEELARTLAQNDLTIFGPGYPYTSE